MTQQRADARKVQQLDRLLSGAVPSEPELDRVWQTARKAGRGRPRFAGWMALPVVAAAAASAWFFVPATEPPTRPFPEPTLEPSHGDGENASKTHRVAIAGEGLAGTLACELDRGGQCALARPWSLNLKQRSKRNVLIVERHLDGTASIPHQSQATGQAANFAFELSTPPGELWILTSAVEIEPTRARAWVETQKRLAVALTKIPFPAWTIARLPLIPEAAEQTKPSPLLVEDRPPAGNIEESPIRKRQAMPVKQRKRDRHKEREAGTAIAGKAEETKPEETKAKPSKRRMPAVIPAPRAAEGTRRVNRPIPSSPQSPPSSSPWTNE